MQTLDDQPSAPQGRQDNTNKSDSQPAGRADSKSAGNPAARHSLTEAAGDQDNNISAADVLHFEKWLGILGQRQATDLHLLVGNVPTLRIDGQMARLDEEEVLTGERLRKIAEHLLTEQDLKKLEKDRQVILGLTLKKTMRFRVHVFYNRGFLAFSLRYLLPEDFSLEQLGLPPIVAEFTQAEQGLLVVTGPFDSGKTTTIKSIVSTINHSQSKYIVMLEKPIEHIIPSDKSVVVQREVGRDVDNFLHGLKILADEDADVVVVSNVEDADAATAGKILRLANSGRLVIIQGTSQHLVGFFEDFRDKFNPQDQPRVLSELANCLFGGVSQLLLPKVGGGRILIAEVLRATIPIASLIRDNKIRQLTNMMQTSRQDGMITLNKALEEAAQAGVITPEDAQEYSTISGSKTGRTNQISQLNNIL